MFSEYYVGDNCYGQFNSKCDCRTIMDRAVEARRMANVMRRTDYDRRVRMYGVMAFRLFMVQIAKFVPHRSWYPFGIGR